jgi:hypothetical protein
MAAQSVGGRSDPGVGCGLLRAAHLLVGQVPHHSFLTFTFLKEEV